MPFNRRSAIATFAAAVAAMALPGAIRATGGPAMYGLIGKLRATAGQRDALTAILLEGVADMPGCLSYVVAHDPDDADALWITEVWADQAAHEASLSLPAVRDAIARGRPLIAGFDQHQRTRPVGGHGLAAGPAPASPR